MNILDRFSNHLREILVRSVRLAHELKNPAVEPIHLFFTLASEKGSVGSEIVNRFKVDPKTLEQLILSLPTEDNADKRKNGDAALAAITPLSEFSKAVLEKAMLVSQEHKHNYIGTEHLLFALVNSNNRIIQDLLAMNKIQLDDLDKQIDTVLGNATQFPQIMDIAEATERLNDHISEEFGEEINPPPEAKGHKHKRNTKKKEAALDFFATNLTSEVAQKNIDPVIGRSGEIERLIQILSRRTKNNPVLLGDPGVGKTAIVEGLAKKIVQGDVPEILLNKKIYALDLGLLIAGTIYRGEFESRLRQVMEEIARDPDVIVFIDEIHNIVGAGSNQGTMDAANILKPMLARGQLRCIGSTTPAEFKKYIENDAALERRFQPIVVREPSLADTVLIIEGIKKNYEQYHKVKIGSDAVTAAVQLSDRYISNKFLPDKAIDLIDETAAAKKLTANLTPHENKLIRLRQRLAKVTTEKEQAAANDRFADAVKFKKEEEKLQIELKTAESGKHGKEITFVGTITGADVTEQLAKIIGVTPTELMLDNKERLKQLDLELKRYVVGQDDAIKEISGLIRQAQLGLGSSNRPLASLMFVGESGVGKTELAKTIAKVLYPTNDALIKLDMSEFHESFSTTKLLGSPAGYVGYKENNQFTDRIKINPHSVILFDEIDKAHRDVLKLLLQILENGEITDATGKKISLRHTIIILTTTMGVDERRRGSFGFNTGNETESQNKQTLEKLKQFFTTELMNRIDRVCFFRALTPADLAAIAELELIELNKRLEAYHTTIESAPEIMNHVIKELGTKANARDVRNNFRATIERLMANILLGEKTKRRYRLSVKENELRLN